MTNIILNQQTRKRSKNIYINKSTNKKTKQKKKKKRRRRRRRTKQEQRNQKWNIKKGLFASKLHANEDCAESVDFAAFTLIGWIAGQWTPSARRPLVGQALCHRRKESKFGKDDIFSGQLWLTQNKTESLTFPIHSHSADFNLSSIHPILPPPTTHPPTPTPTTPFVFIPHPHTPLCLCGVGFIQLQIPWGISVYQYDCLGNKEWVEVFRMFAQNCCVL